VDDERWCRHIWKLRSVGSKFEEQMEEVDVRGEATVVTQQFALERRISKDTRPHTPDPIDNYVGVTYAKSDIAPRGA
jgi:hypothetical protein